MGRSGGALLNYLAGLGRRWLHDRMLPLTSAVPLTPSPPCLPHLHRSAPSQQGRHAGLLQAHAAPPSDPSLPHPNLPIPRSKGATLGCFKRTCRASYHLACARKYSCLLQVRLAGCWSLVWLACAHKYGYLLQVSLLKRPSHPL